MIRFLKEQLVSRKVKKLLRSQKKVDMVFPIEIRHVGILAASEEEFEQSKELIRQNWGLKVRITGLFYTDEVAKKAGGFSYREFSLWGEPSDFFLGFLEEKMDFILIPALKLNAYLRYLLLTKQSSFRLGFYSEENKPYLDLMVEPEDEDPSKNIALLITYLNKIQSAC